MRRLWTRSEIGERGLSILREASWQLGMLAARLESRLSAPEILPEDAEPTMDDVLEVVANVADGEAERAHFATSPRYVLHSRHPLEAELTRCGSFIRDGWWFGKGPYNHLCLRCWPEGSAGRERLL